MPVMRYFLFVGTALLALLFIVDASFPKLPATDNANITANAASDLSVIRIQSNQKWPARVEFDTSLPTVTPAAAVLADTNAPVGTGTSARIRDTFAQLQTTQIPKPDPQTTEPKKAELKPPPKRKTVASRTASKSRTGPPVILVAQQPHFGLFPNTIW